jgi:hypothetical protein
MRYVKNRQTGEIHDRQDADERCNVDDIVEKQESDDLGELLGHQIGSPAPNFCQWCCGSKKKE